MRPALSPAGTPFDASRTVFVFLWVPMIQGVADPAENLPFGIIFSGASRSDADLGSISLNNARTAFMVSMILGSLVYSSVISSNRDGRPRLLHAKMCGLLCLVAALGLAIAARVEDPRWRFYCFCLFEGTVGLYWPTLGTMRGEMIPEDCRATVRYFYASLIGV